MRSPISRGIRRAIAGGVRRIDAISRYFTELAAAFSQYYTIPAVTLTGDFEIEVDFVSTNTLNYDRLIGNVSGTNKCQINLSGVSGKVYAEISDGTTTVYPTAAAIINDGKIHTVKLRFVAATDTYYMSADGGAEVSATLAGVNNEFATIGKNYTSGGAYFDGIIANVKITDAGTLVRDYKIDERWAGDDVLIDQVTVLGSDLGSLTPSAGGISVSGSTVSGTSVAWSFMTNDVYYTAGTAYLVTITNRTGSDEIRLRDGAADLVTGITGSGSWLITPADTSFVIQAAGAGFSGSFDILIQEASGYGQAVNITSADAEKFTFNTADNAWIGQERAHKDLVDWPIKNAGVTQPSLGVFDVSYSGAADNMLRDSALFNLNDTVKWSFTIANRVSGEVNLFIGNANKQTANADATYSGIDQATVSDGRVAFTSSTADLQINSLSTKRALGLA